MNFLCKGILNLKKKKQVYEISGTVFNDFLDHTYMPIFHLSILDGNTKHRINISKLVYFFAECFKNN